jgi:uncharacterized membrane protein
MGRLRNHWRHHGRFYIPALIGAVVYAVLSIWSDWPFSPRILAAGDTFFAIYLAAAAIGIAGLTPKDLQAKAAIEDEGIAIVMTVAFAMIVLSSVAIITVLHQKHGAPALPIALALLGIPLGWFVLHTLVAFHYAYIFYGRLGSRKAGGLEFPGTAEPGVWEFLYYAFTIGTTAQTSDTNVHTTRMRRATLVHSVVSFFYNTAILAMSVNAVVSIAS